MLDVEVSHRNNLRNHKQTTTRDRMVDSDSLLIVSAPAIVFSYSNMSDAVQVSLERLLDIVDNRHANSLLRKLDRMRKERRECDLVIKVGKEELHVHRYVMIAGSDYFDAMFSHDTQESQSGVVEMKEVPFPILKKCIVFIYTGKISIVEEECEEVLYVGNILQLTEVCNKVAPFLQSCINSRSFFNIKKIAVRYDFDDLNKVCDNFAIENFDLIMKKEDFYKLEMEYVCFLIQGRKDSNLDSDPILELILEWIKVDIENRQHNLVAMTSLLDIGNVSESLIAKLVEEEPVCYESGRFMKMLYLAEKDKAKVPKEPCKSEPNSVIIFNISKHCLTSYHPPNKFDEVMSYSRGDTWIDYFTAVSFESIIYMLLDSQKFYKATPQDPALGWVELSDMKKPHGKFISAAILNGYIYVLGAGTVERYSIWNMKWEIIDSNLINCDASVLVAFHGCIYSIGGENENSVNKFCPDSASWTPVKAMIETRATPGATAHNGKIDVAGGFRHGCFLSSVECFDPKTESWTQLASMCENRTHFRLLFVSNKLYAVGCGYNSSSIEFYDVDTDKWELAEAEESLMLGAASLAMCLPSVAVDATEF